MARHADGLLATIEQAADREMDRRIGVRAAQYRRDRDLRRLSAPGHVRDSDGRAVLCWLRAALRAERARALAGHWSYDANRHVMLRAALAAERDRGDVAAAD